MQKRYDKKKKKQYYAFQTNTVMLKRKTTSSGVSLLKILSSKLRSSQLWKQFMQMRIKA